MVNSQQKTSPTFPPFSGFLGAVGVERLWPGRSAKRHRFPGLGGVHPHPAAVPGQLGEEHRADAGGCAKGAAWPTTFDLLPTPGKYRPVLLVEGCIPSKREGMFIREGEWVFFPFAHALLFFGVG